MDRFASRRGCAGKMQPAEGRHKKTRMSKNRTAGLCTSTSCRVRALLGPSRPHPHFYSGLTTWGATQVGGSCFHRTTLDAARYSIVSREYKSSTSACRALFDPPMLLENYGVLLAKSDESAISPLLPLWVSTPGPVIALRRSGWASYF